MNSKPQSAAANLQPLVTAWLALLALTLISLALGQWFRGAPWLPLLVAAIVWIKSSLVTGRFLEARLAHPFIARVLAGFIAFTPMALVLTAFFGAQFARWASL